MSSSSVETELRVADAPASHRFEAHLDGELVGFTSYVRDDEQVDYQHTMIGPAYEGMGVGPALARAALDDAAAKGLRTRVSCPLIRAWLAEHAAQYPGVQTD